MAEVLARPTLLTDGTGWSHWDFTAKLSGYPDLARPDDRNYAALATLEPR